MVVCVGIGSAQSYVIKRYKSHISVITEDGKEWFGPKGKTNVACLLEYAIQSSPQECASLGRNGEFSDSLSLTFCVPNKHFRELLLEKIPENEAYRLTPKGDKKMEVILFRAP